MRSVLIKVICEDGNNKKLLDTSCTIYPTARTGDWKDSGIF